MEIFTNPHLKGWSGKAICLPNISLYLDPDPTVTKASNNPERSIDHQKKDYVAALPANKKYSS